MSFPGEAMEEICKEGTKEGKEGVGVLLVAKNEALVETIAQPL